MAGVIYKKYNIDDLNLNGISPQSTLEYKDIPIKGIPVSVSYVMSEFKAHEEAHTMGDDAFKNMIKQELAKQLVEEIQKQNVIEYTMQKDQISSNRMYRARAFLVPSSDVQILRTLNK